MGRFEAPIHFTADTGYLGTNLANVVVKAIEAFAYSTV